MQQRELTFRVFNCQTKQYDKGLFPSATTGEEGYFTFIPDEANQIVEQYTGYKDPADKMIFEGDLMRHKADGNEPRPVFKVVMCDGAWELRSLSEKEGDGTIIMPLAPVDLEYEVIGQALSNPDI